MLLVAAALVAGGCGGDSAQDEGVSRVAYVAEVDALCRDVAMKSRSRDRRMQALVDGSGSFTSRLRKGAPLLRATYAVQKAKLERFKRIEPPIDDRARIKALTVAAERALEDLGESLPAADRGDLPAFIDLITDASGARGTAERLGLNYGLRADCFGSPVKLG